MKIDKDTNTHKQCLPWLFVRQKLEFFRGVNVLRSTIATANTNLLRSLGCLAICCRCHISYTWLSFIQWVRSSPRTAFHTGTVRCVWATLGQQKCFCLCSCTHVILCVVRGRFVDHLSILVRRHRMLCIWHNFLWSRPSGWADVTVCRIRPLNRRLRGRVDSLFVMC